MPLDRLTKLDPLQLGRFMILARLGAGGMGNVYLAEADDGTPAAVKVIRAELALDPQLRARFRREVEAGRRVDNLCIARYLDADTFAASPWLATEFVAGPTLHHEVFARGPVIGPRVIGLAAGLADALVAIHAAGLVHRDLKPANVLMAPDAPKVIDFGISLAAEATQLTTTGMLVGSPAYMSPEQARGMKDVGAPADVFAWASCMTFASRREPPFGEGEAAGLVYKVVHERPDLTGVPAGLLPFLQAALDKDPAGRPTAAELVAGLAAVLDGVPAARLVVPPPEGGPARVVAPVAAPGQAGLILAATWEPDAGAAEAAERTLAEAHALRASLPPRADERQRRERSRANRAVFSAMLVALLAVLVVAFVMVRPGQTELAKARDNGRGPDAEPSTTALTPTSSTAPTGSAAPGPGTSPGGPPTTGGAPAGLAGSTPTGGGAPGSTPATQTPTSGGGAAAGPT
ncbi:MAG: serine/threonine-protein kinase, partial [Acidimicrobiales bacterium]